MGPPAAVLNGSHNSNVKMTLWATLGVRHRASR